MDVIGYDPRPDFPRDAARQSGCRSMSCSKRADVVSLHVSLRRQTRHLIGRQSWPR